MKKGSPQRKQILVDWNDTAAPYPKDKTIYQLFEEQVNKSPDNIAVIFEDEKLSYKELNKKSNQLARLIRDKYKSQNKKDLKPDNLIGLCVERSLNMIIGILGILKAGGAYVPLDPDYPQDRLEYMIKDSHEGLIITQKDVLARDGFLDKLHHDELLVIDSDEIKLNLKRQSDANLDNISGPDNLAYVIYTSGSTGRPKGVMIEHSGVCNLAKTVINNFDIKAKTKVLQFASICFDASVYEYCGTLTCGGSLHLLSDSELPPHKNIDQLLLEKEIEVAMLPPALLETVEQINLPKLRTVVSGGDRLTPEVFDKWSKGRRLINAYGPTESTVCCSMGICEDKINIGKAINNKQLYILDNNLNPCPIGAPGELYIGGAGLARGYLNQEELTKERFIPNPFAKELGLESTDRIYKTGDLVRWLPGGNIEYIGRTDFQVKIRGFRIELGEIENVLAKHKAISQVSVIDKEKEGSKYLAAYYVITKDKKAPEIDDLRSYLSETLPDYMVPSAFVKLDEMPLTPNGKINRRALPDPDMSLMGEEYIAPRNEIEEKLADIWSDVLKIDKDKIGIHDNFLHLGGHSLLAIQLVARIHAKLNCDISIKNLFDKPKLMDLSLLIESQIKEGTGIAYSPIKKTKLLKDGNAMSFAQERLWFLDQFEGSNENYNIPIILKLEGELDIKALKSSFNQLVARHASFRTVFTKDKTGVGVQKILDKLELTLVAEKLDNKAKGKALENLIKAEINKEISTPFDFIKGPLIRVRLFEVTGGSHCETTSKQSPSQYVLVFNHHHIISDGVSVDIILKELSEFYKENIEKREAKLDKLPIQYVDFAAWQRAEFKKPEFQDKLKYWKDTLCDYSDLQLPTDKSRPTTFSYKGADFNFSLDKDLSAKLSKLAQDNGTTLYMVLLTAFNVLLSRYSGQDDVILGSPIANRYHHDIEGLVGFFVNTLVLRNQVDSNKSVKELLNQISSDTLSAFDNQEVPFEQIVELLDVTRDTSRNPIVQVMFSLQSFGGDASGESALKLKDLDIKTYSDASYDVAKLDLDVNMQETEAGLVGGFNYCSDLFNQETIERMVRNFERLLSAIVENSDTKIKDLRLLTDERRKQILVDWNDTKAHYPKDKTIYQLFEEQVKKTPDNIAVIFEDEKLSYSNLNKKSNQLARLIRDKYKSQNKKDLKPDNLIGLCVERSLDMIIGILGILKAGAAYVPLDPDYPQDRLEYMIEDSHEGLIITQKDVLARDGFLDNLHHDELLVIDTDEVKAELSKQSAENLEQVSGPNDLAYVIYTSGSTGKPKGVTVEHISICNLVQAYNLFFGINQKDRFSQLSNYAFDVFGAELWPAITNGSRLYIAKKSTILNSSKLVDWLIDNRITISDIPVKLSEILFTEAWPSCHDLRYIKVGGEAVNILPNKDLGFTVVNAYGPTESTIDTTLCEVFKKGVALFENIPIGKAISNINLYVLDNNLNPCPIGAPGELYIGGAGLARGYLNQDKLTKERFITNPFAKELGLSESDRIYKTGDLVRWLSDGNIEYLGRTDFQVKIRGFRIELGEIENVLSKHKSISQVIVIAKEKDSQKYLAAFYVIAKGKKAPEIDDLRSYLSETLPDYMVPAAFVKLNEMPLTPNGKIDRKALPDPDMSLMGGEYIAPRNEIEKKLADIWCDILKLEQIGIHDNFFSMGGDSIISIQLVSRARNSDIYFTPKDLFQNPTIAQLALIDLKGSAIEAEQGLVVGDAPLIPIQIEFFEQSYENQDHWNQAQLLQISDSLDLDILEKAVAAVIHHHDGLHLRYSPDRHCETTSKQSRAKHGEASKNQLVDYKQYYDDAKSALNIKVKKIDLAKIKSKEQATKLTEHCSKIQGSLDIKSGPVMAVAVFSGLSDGKDRLLIAIHHLMVDGVSWRVIIPDLESCYKQIKDGKEVKLSPKTSSYQDWGNALVKYADNKAIDDLDYWLKISESIKPLKHDFDCKQDYATNMDGMHISWDKKHTDDLLNKTQQAYNTEINDLLLSAFALALANWQQIDNVSFNLEGHGREDCVSGVDITRTVGWFTSLFPVALSLPEIKDINNLTDLDYKACVQSIKEQLRAIPDKGLSYGALKYCVSPSLQEQIDAIANLKISKASFNYLGQFGGDDKSQDKNSWGFAPESSGFAVDPKNHHPNLLDLNGMVMDGVLGFSIAFSADHFSKESIDEFSELFKEYLLKIIEHCASKKEVAYTPSDFATTNLSQVKLDQILTDTKADKIYALSPLQEGMLFHALHAEESDQYCVQIEWTYEGKLDPKALKSAWEGVINHHDILRTRFVWQDVDNPVQVVEQEVAIPWFSEDFSKSSQKDQAKKLQDYLVKDRFAGFNLSKPCVMRLHLIKLSDTKYHFIWTSHHILLDGWCNPILFGELANRYDAITKGKKPVISQAPSYERYIEFIKAQDKKEADKFWADKLGEIDAATDIKVHKAGVKLDPNKPIKDLGTVNHIFDVSKTKEMEDFAKAQKVTINSFVQLAWANILSRYSGESNVIYGSVLSGRSHNIFGIDKMVGLLINTLPMSIIIDADKSVSDNLEQVHQTVQEVNHYSYCGLSEVQRLSGVTSGDPLFNVLFVFENYPAGDAGEETDLAIKDVQGHEKTNYPITVTSFISGGQLQLKIDYDKECFADEVVKTLLMHITNFMLRVMEDAEQSISKVRILEEQERKQILVDWNDTSAPYPKDKIIYQLFEEQANKTPDNIAVVFEDEKLSYKDLNKKSNQLARLIRAKYKKQNKKDLKPDSLIGLCVERSLDMIIGILGILKAGGAYVPLDPDYPQDRLEYMIEDSHEGLIITQKDIAVKGGFLDKLHHDELLVIDSDEVKAGLKKQSDTNLDKVSGPDNLAYVIYTSGSTGRPKGVLLPHHNVLRLFLATDNQYKFGNKDVWTLFHSYAFDFSVWEIWGPLLHGGKLVVVPHMVTRDPELFYDLVCEQKVTVLNQTPGAFQQFIGVDDQRAKKIDSLRYVIFGGDALNIEILRPWWQNHADNKPLLVNMYGITETTVHVTYGALSKKNLAEANVGFVGKHIKDLQAYILDKNHNVCPIGAPGELYIGGAGLARGYLNQDKLTKERFISNPFAKELGLSKSDRIYKTGDLVRWLPDGNIEYIGRTDFQVKIRGFRIELGEIENALAKHKNISQVSVIDKEKEGSKYLVAYYVIAKDKKAPEIDALRDYLSETLPDYMVPSAFVKLDEMPLTPNGKIDRKAFPDPDMSLMGEEYVAPRNEIEKKLAEIWSDVLKIDQDKIGIHDNFFHLGGHSLLAIQLVARIHAKLNCDISIKNLFDKPKLMDLSLFIEGQIKEGTGIAYSPIKKTKLLESGNAMSFAQERLWFLNEFEGSNENYNIPMIFRLEGKLDIKALKSSLNKLIARHASFRTVFTKDKTGVGVQKILDKLELNLVVEKLDAKLKGKDLEKIIKAEINKEISTPFDFVKGPLIRVRLFEAPDGSHCETALMQSRAQHIFVLNHHHIISDGVSVDIILKELSEFYQANLEKREPKLDKIPIQYVDFAAWQRAEFKKPEFQDKLKYWKDILCDYSDLQLPTDKSRPTTFSYKGADFNFSLDKDLSDKLSKLAQDNGTTVYMVLLTAFNVLLSRYSGSDDIILSSPIANRYHHDLEGLVGFFVNTLILRNQVDSNKSVKELLNQISSDTLSAFDNQEVPFEQIVELLDVTRDTSRNPIVQVMFSLQSFSGDGSGEPALKLPGVNIKSYDDASYDVAKFDLSLFMSEAGDELAGSFNYCSDLFAEDTISRLARNFDRLLESFVENSSAKIKDLRLLTDQRRKQILIDWNDTSALYPKDKTIHQLFEDQVNKTPNNIAVVFESEKLSYKDLNEKSNQLARLIREKYKKQNKKDLKPDSLIGLCAERSLNMIIGILGILKAGGAYVPLDPDYPQDRLEYMIKDSHEGLIITQKDIVAKDGFLDKLHHDELLVIDSDEVKAELKKQSAANLEQVSGPDNLAYVIYTSGSTGKPKGVMIEHASVSNYMGWLHGYLDLDDQTASDCSSNIAFDFTLSVSVASLIKGHKVCLCSDDSKKDLNQYVQHIINNNISYAKLTPGYLSVLLEHIKSAGIKLPLRKIILGGEALKTIDVRDWLDINPECQFYNEYGPTEATVGVSQHTYTMNNCMESVAGTLIGAPGFNIRYYVLDANLNPCPIGSPGELYIAGDCLARGYLNKEDQTKERFITNPFAKELGLEPTDKIYKTGDLVRWLADGNIEYLGRTDFQVKIRGFRIELGEIENVLAKHKNISQVSVIDKEKEGQKYLVAYYVITKDKKAPEIDDLRSYLSETLPDYMVPAAFVKLDEMPLTPNGKINRRALPDPDMRLMGEEYVAPRNEIEKKLAMIWCDLLGLEKVGINDDFFKIGGNSIKSIQIVSKIRRAGIDTSVKNFFDNPTIKKVSDNLSKQKKKEIKVVKSEQGILTGEFDLLASQKLLLDKKYTKRALVKVDKLDFHKLCKIIPDLISHHDMLRATFINKKGVWKQKYNKKINIPEIKQLDVSKLKNQDELNKILTQWQSGFNLEKGPLWQIRYLHGYKDNSARIFIGFHRLIIDDESSKILIKDIQSLYKGESLGEKSCSYRQWVDAINKYPKTHSKESAYWKYVNKRQPEFAKNIKFSKTSQQCKFSLSKGLTKKLLNIANKAYNTEVNDLLLCALAYALRDWSNSDVNYINLRGYNRSDLDAGINSDNTLGNFEYKYPMELKLLQNYRASIPFIKESLRDTPNNGLGYISCGYKDNISINYKFLGELDHNQLININNFDDESDKLNIKSFISNSDNTLGFIINAFADKDNLDKFRLHLEHHIEKIIGLCVKRVKKDKSIKTYSDLDDYIQYEIINDSAKNTPVIFFPPIDGGFETYISLGFFEKLKDLQILLFNPHTIHLYDKTKKIKLYKETNINEIAEDYLLRLKKIYPKGPYCLAGYSSGGVLAFSVAKELVKQGDKISKLIMLDSDAPNKLIKECKKNGKINLNAEEIILCKCTQIEKLIKTEKKDLLKYIKSNIKNKDMYLYFLKLIFMGTFHKKYRNKIIYFFSPKLTSTQFVINKYPYNKWDKMLSDKIKVLKYEASHTHTSWIKTTLVSDISKEILSIKGLKKKK